MSLTRYRAKRRFSRTPEPAGRKAGSKQRRGTLGFVIQKHAARSLHYDFRLEMGGTLKSWAVPKGFPTEKGEKRLAMQVEDHPLEYGDFGGVIPPGNYGGGSVMLWDRGTYEILEGESESALRQGKLVLLLAGRKLKGHWTLVQMRSRSKEDNAWLLIKTGESVRPISKRADDRSVKSGRGMKQIAAAGDQWVSSAQAKSDKPKPRHPDHPSNDAKVP